MFRVEYYLCTSLKAGNSEIQVVICESYGFYLGKNHLLYFLYSFQG